MATKGRRLYYTMGQVCELFDLPASTIRFWETRFSIIRPKKNAKGNRLFTPEDIENLKLIYHLTKEKKMTLAGAEKYMLQRKVAARGEMTVVELLQKIRSTLLEIRQELDTTEREEKNAVVVRGEQVETLDPTADEAPATYEEPTYEAPAAAAPAPEEEKPRFIELTLF